MAMHHQAGCLICGALRSVKDMCAKTYDVYLVNRDTNMTRVGLCRGCFEKAEFDLEKMKTRLVESERAVWMEKGYTREEADRMIKEFLDKDFVNVITYRDFWEKYERQRVAHAGA